MKTETEIEGMRAGLIIAYHAIAMRCDDPETCEALAILAKELCLLDWILEKTGDNPGGATWRQEVDMKLQGHNSY